MRAEILRSGDDKHCESHQLGSPRIVDPDTERKREPDMPKAAHIHGQITDFNATQDFRNHALVPVALFSGIGLSLCLIAVFMGLRGIWF
jgi:hypothetical protein